MEVQAVGGMTVDDFINFMSKKFGIHGDNIF